MKKIIRKHARKQKGGEQNGITDHELAEKLYELCKDRQSAWARENKFSRQYVNAVCTGRMPITEKLAKILGYKRVKNWVKLTE